MGRGTACPPILPPLPPPLTPHPHVRFPFSPASACDTKRPLREACSTNKANKTTAVGLLA